MKTSTVLASMLFGTLAAAAPFDKRKLVVKTEVVTQTVVVYTTVYDDKPVAAVTTTPQGLFYEASTTPSSAAAKPTSAAPAPVSSASEEKKPSSAYNTPAAPQTPTPTPTPTPEQAKPTSSAAAYTLAASVVSSAAPIVSSVVAAAPVASSAAAVPQAQAATTGQTYAGDITIYDNTGAAGACGKALYDTDMIVALAQPTWGQSTYDYMTGAATNPWCGQKIQIQYNGNSIVATIMDLCPGCVGADIDLSLAAWKALTGLDEKTRLKATWSKIA